MSDCIFCKIIKKEIPAQIVYEDDFALAFKDINPEAPHHYLIIPKKHLPNLEGIHPADRELAGRLLETAAKVADMLGLRDAGYRIVINNGAGAGQLVLHTHMHMLSGRPFSWPPG